MSFNEVNPVIEVNPVSPSLHNKSTPSFTEKGNKNTTTGRSFKSIPSGICPQKSLLWKGIALMILGLGLYQVHRTNSIPVPNPQDTPPPYNASLFVCPKTLPVCHFPNGLTPICKDNVPMSPGDCVSFPDVFRYHSDDKSFVILMDDPHLFDPNRFVSTFHLIPDSFIPDRYDQSIFRKFEEIVYKISVDKLKKFDFDKLSPKKIAFLIRNLLEKKDFHLSVFSPKQLAEIIKKLPLHMLNNDGIAGRKSSIEKFISKMSHEQFMSIINEFPEDSSKIWYFKEHFDAISDIELKSLIAIGKCDLHVLKDKIREKISIFSGAELSMLIKRGFDIEFISKNISKEQFKELNFESIRSEFINLLQGMEWPRKKEMIALIPAKDIPSLAWEDCIIGHGCFLNYLTDDQIRQLEFNRLTLYIDHILLQDTNRRKCLINLLSDQQIVAISDSKSFAGNTVLSFINEERLMQLGLR